MRGAVTGAIRVALCLAAVLALTGLGASAASAADSCPNAAYRKGDGAKLPDCRAWEQATPVNKGGGQPIPTFGAFPSPSGDRVMSASPSNVGGASGGAYAGSYASTRQGLAWGTIGVDGPLDSYAGDFFDFVGHPTVGYSDDRTKALVASLRKLTPGAVEGDTNLYVRDTASGSYTFAATTPGDGLYAELSGVVDADQNFYASTPDFRHILFTASAALAPGALGTGELNLYDVSGGQITLVSRDQNGDAFPVAARSHPGSGPRLISDDGRRITIGLRQRIDGTSTVSIAPADPQGDDNGVWPSADGTAVTFATQTLDLTNDGTPSPFYRWEDGPGGGTLTNLLRGATVPWSSPPIDFDLLHVSPDGRYVWFTVNEAPVPGDDTKNTTKIEVLDTQAKRVTVKGTGLTFVTPAQEFFRENLESFRFSPDGTKMVAITNRALTGYDNARPEAPCDADFARQGAPSYVCIEAFAFDATSTATTPVCISCGPPGSHSAGDAGVANLTFIGRPLSTVVTDDGRILFDTPQRLVAADANDLSDVYEYVPGRGSALISSGTGNGPAKVAGISESGDDAFFFSADPLVAQDDDDAVDIYDARVDGGLAAQQVARPSGSSCPSGACPGAQTPLPAPTTPGSALVTSPARPPAFSVSRVSAAARRTAARTGQLRLSVKVGASGRLSARVSSRLGRRQTVVGRSSLAARRAGRYTLAVTLSRAARRALARDRELVLALSVSYSRASKPASQSVSLAVPRVRRSTKGDAR